MFTIENSNYGTKVTVKTEGAVKRILRKIKKQHGESALKGIYIHHPMSGTWYAVDMEL